ncbi:MAG: ABC transporter permease [Methanomicrobiales archaeon]|nr:ABC transporter permease [Methanomicrobiales archaeon]
MTPIVRIPFSYRFGKVWRRNLVTFMRTWKVNFIPPFLEPLLYLLALGLGVGSFITQVEGVSYPRFIAPALISIAVMNAAFFECTYSSYVRMYYQKTFDAMITTPLSIEDVILGELCWGATRSFIYALLMFPVLLAFGVIDLPSSFLIFPFSLLAGFLFASLGMCFTAVSPGIDTLNYPSFLLITPMFLFSGTFFPLNLLPVPVQIVAYGLLPLTHVVAVMRGFCLGILSLDLLLSITWLAIASTLLCPVAIHLMKKRLII